jgi:hypothetical protein
VETQKDLERIARIEPLLAPDGALWVVHPKGRKDLQDVHVIAAAKACQLTDNKVVRFSDTHSALRLCIPLARRKDRA